MLTKYTFIFAGMYQAIRRILFLLEAEKAHYAAMNGLRILCSFPIIKNEIARYFTPATEPTSLFGLSFKNKVGLGAGFDKNARYLRELEALGFGFVEIGTVTPRPQSGNDKPRLFRLPKDKALINRMGFNNDGVQVVAERLKSWREKAEVKSQKLKIKNSAFTNHSPLIIGGNIGKNKNTQNEEAWKDYEICFTTLHPYVDFFVVNVSSPNTPGLRELQEKESLQKILTHLQGLNATFTKQKPILLKIAPDLSFSQIDDVIELALAIKLDGLVATNTTIERSNLHTAEPGIAATGPGGLSGKPLQQRSTQVVQYIVQKASGKIPVIASGGIFTAADAAEKWNAGASLIEVWTGFIYEGPMIVKNICTGKN